MLQKLNISSSAVNVYPQEILNMWRNIFVHGGQSWSSGPQQHSIKSRHDPVMEIIAWASRKHRITTVCCATHKCSLKKKAYIHMIQKHHHQHLLTTKADLKWTEVKWSKVWLSDPVIKRIETWNSFSETKDTACFRLKKRELSVQSLHLWKFEPMERSYLERKWLSHFESLFFFCKENIYFGDNHGSKSK